MAAVGDSIPAAEEVMGVANPRVGRTVGPPLAEEEDKLKFREHTVWNMERRVGNMRDRRKPWGTNGREAMAAVTAATFTCPITTTLTLTTIESAPRQGLTHRCFFIIHKLHELCETSGVEWLRQSLQEHRDLLRGRLPNTAHSVLAQHREGLDKRCDNIKWNMFQ